MALRGTLTHRKTRRLAQILKISQCTALGILEALWHVAGENQNDGGIGRMPDQDIADEMYYDGDAGELIAALIKSGWLDAVENTVEKGRLFVHDWHLHADDSVNSKLIQWVKVFANGEPPRLRRLSQPARERTIAKYVERYGANIRQKMICVCGDAHDAPDAHIQKPESRSQSPEARVQKPETNLLTDSSVDKTSTPSTAHPPVQSGSKISVPKKPMLPATTTSAGSAANELLSANRVSRMRTILHDYMRQVSDTGPPEVWQPPDDGTVLNCITAVGAIDLEEVAKYLIGLWKGGQRRGRSNGPKTYGWFVDRLRAKYGGKTT